MLLLDAVSLTCRSIYGYCYLNGMPLWWFLNSYPVERLSCYTAKTPWPCRILCPYSPRVQLLLSCGINIVAHIPN